MVSDTLEQRIYELVRSHDGIYLFKKKELTPSIGMLIASARAGRWLYELIHAGGLLFAFRYYGAHNVYYVKCTRTIKRHVKAAGFLHVKKLLVHKFDPFPAVTLREFC
ncbi:DUF1493 family protein [Salmonella enterica]|nr:DUF1493 family protein [Salmonella enterica]